MAKIVLRTEPIEVPDEVAETLLGTESKDELVQHVNLISETGEWSYRISLPFRWERCV
jgi:hypothetical protein